MTGLGKSLPEEKRNRLLRRADWRFLLPNPAPENSVCFAGGALEEAVNLISKNTVRPEAVNPSLGYDLVVAINPNKATLQAAWSFLRPGGSLYTERYFPSLRRPQGLKKRLEKLGFEKVACYWPWPLPSRQLTQFWLPCEAPHAVYYFLNNRPKPVSSKEKAQKKVLYYFWKLTTTVGLILPVCVISIKPARSTEPIEVKPAGLPSGSAPAESDPFSHSLNPSDQKPGVEEIIQANLQDWGFGTAPAKLAWVLLTGGRRSINKVVGLVFVHQQATPGLVVKMPRVAEAIQGLYREAATLAEISSLRPGGFPGVPRLLFSQIEGESMALGETVLTGLPLFTELRHDNYRELALKATDWLINLAGNPQPEPRRVWWNRLGEPVLEEFRELFGSIVSQSSLQKIENILSGLELLPIVCEHRDFSPWNVLLSDSGELVVLDWEGAELRGLPGLDLIYFLTYLALFLDKALDTGSYTKSYQALLDPRSFTGQVFSECLERYASQTSLDRSAWRPLRLLTWLLHSRSEYRHFTEDIGGKPDAQLLKSSLFIGLCEVELGLNDLGQA